MRPPSREWIASRLPSVLLDYPFEVIIGCAALISGAPRLVRFVADDAASTTAQVLPWWAGVMWGVSLLLSAVTILGGLATRRYLTVLPTGLRLLAVSSLAYALTAAVAAGAPTPGTVMLLAIAGMCCSRAFILTTQRVMGAKILAEARRMDNAP